MCVSAELSFASFAVGSVFNAAAFCVIRKSHTTADALAVLYWQFALLMQLPEGAAWTHIDAGRTTSAAGRAAMVLNVLQPIVACAVVLAHRSRRHSVAATTGVAMYAILLCTDAADLWAGSDRLEPRHGCVNLDLGWWDLSRTALYVASTLVCMCGFGAMRLVHLAIFVATLLVSIAVYPCGGGSLWCWLIAFAGLALLGAQCSAQHGLLPYSETTQCQCCRYR